MLDKILNQTLKWTFVAMTAFGLFIVYTLASREPRSGCDHEIMAESISPTRKYYAYVKMFDCGVLVSGDEIFVASLNGDSTPVLIARTSWTGSCGDTPCVTIRWTSPTSFVVSLCAKWDEGHGTAVVDGQEVSVSIENACGEGDASQSARK